jgi:hypothetical protein
MNHEQLSRLEDKLAPYHTETYQACEPWKRHRVVGPSISFGGEYEIGSHNGLDTLLNIAFMEGYKMAIDEIRGSVANPTEPERDARIAELEKALGKGE